MNTDIPGLTNAERSEAEKHGCDFDSGQSVEPAGDKIDVPQSQEELDELSQQYEESVDDEPLHAHTRETQSGPEPKSEQNHEEPEPESESDEQDSDFLEFARVCKCGASFRSKSAFENHVDEVNGGKGVCSAAKATDGGATVAPSAPSGPTINPEKPMVPDLTTSDQLVNLMDEHRETFVTVMTLCQKRHNGMRPRRQALQAIVGMDGPTYEELMDVLGASLRTVKKYVGELRDAGLVVTMGQPSQIVFDDWTMGALANHVLHLTR